MRPSVENVVQERSYPVPIADIDRKAGNYTPQQRGVSAVLAITSALSMGKKENKSGEEEEKKVPIFLSPIANPLAGKKLKKRVVKLIGSASACTIVTVV